MQRWIASVVLCVMSWGPLAPMAIASTGDVVPACCHRGGKHHCSAMEVAAGASEDGAPHASTRLNPCPYRNLKAAPSATARIHVPVDVAQFVPKAGRVFSLPINTPEFRRTATVPQRGPPQALIPTNS